MRVLKSASDFSTGWLGLAVRFFFHLDLTTEMQLEEKVSIIGLFIVQCSLGNLLTNSSQLKSAAEASQL